jgi:hypothetical protein
MAAPMSDEELYQLTGSWEAAAAMRDEQARGATQNTQTAAVNTQATSTPPLLDQLKALYAEKGATTRREEETEGGTKYYDDPIQYLGGWSAWEKQPTEIIDYIGQGMDATPIYKQIDPADKLGGFARTEGDKSYFYDTNGKLVHVEKTDTSFYDRFGPMIMAAMTMGGGSAALGSYLFPSLGATAAAGAGGALVGGANAAMTDQDILTGALKGGLSSAGALKLSDVVGADALGSTFKDATLGDVNKAINFAQNPSLAGAANLASPFVTTNFNIGDTGFTTNDVLKGLNTVQALGSGDNQKIFNTITGLAKGTDFSGLTASEQAERDANREAARLNRIENAVLNQPASDDGTTQGILDLIGEMYPAADIKGMSEGDLAKFLEANINEIQGSADLETLLKGAGQTTADEGTVTVTGDRPTGLGDFMVPTGNIGDQGEMVITGNKNGISLNDFITLNDIAGDTSNNYADDTVFVTDKKDDGYVSNLRTKDIKSDITEITADDIDKLFPDINVNDILQTVTVPGGTKTVVPTTKTPPPTVKKTTEDVMDSLGLGRQAPSQDPYANIKSMEDLFGGDIAYKLRALGVNPSQKLASSDMDELVRLLRG